MSNRNLGSFDKSLASVLNDLYNRLEQVARRRPTGTGGGGDCDCEDGAPGLPGRDGQDGNDGAPGVGVPAGGTAGQSLLKASGTDYDTGWGTPDPPELELDNLTDVNTSGEANNDILKYNFGSNTWFPGSLFLDELTDVTAPSPSDGDALVWDAGGSAWVPTAVAGGVTELGDLADVTTVGVGDNDFLKYDLGSLEWTPGDVVINDIAEVIITTPTNGDVLTYDSGDWINQAPASGGGWGGAVTIPYHFSTTTTNSDPGSGNLRLDQATQDSSSTVRVDVLDVNGASWETLIDTMGTVNHDPMGYLRLVRDADPTDWMLWDIQAVDSSSGYRNITVTLVEVGNQAGSSPFVNGELVYLLYDRNGDDGADGADGTTATSIVAYDENTSDTSTITTVADTGLSVTFTAVAGRQYEVSYGGLVVKGSTNDICNLILTDGSNNMLDYISASLQSGETVDLWKSIVFTPGAGSITYKVRASANSGNVIVDSGTDHRAALLVKDLTGGATTGEVTTASPLGAPGTPNLLRSYKGVMFMDTGNYWWPMGGAMEQIAYEWTHFFNNNAQKIELQSSVSGGSADAGVASAGNQGVLSLSTSTSSTGRAGYAAGQSSALRGTADKLMHYHTRVRVPTLSTSGERFYFTAGYLSSMTGVPGDGFYFRYDDSVSANWYAVVVNNTAGTAGVSTGVAVATNTFQKLRIEIDEPNVSAKFYVDNVLTNTITTNFPGSTRDFGPAVNMRKTVGTTARTVDVDYLGWWSLMTTTV